MAILRIIQPNDWGCMAAVAAMIVGTGYEETVASIRPESNSDKPFSDQEITKYLLINGFVMSQDIHPPGSYDTEAMIRWISRMGLLSSPALISVKSMKRPHPAEHAILWTGDTALDPNPDIGQPIPLLTYEITRWAPLGHLLIGDKM